jgi:flagellar hook-associated protein 2
MATSTLTSIGTTTSNTSSTAASLAITGLASGMDWSTVVTALANAERSPEIQWQAQQATLASENAAYSTITTELTTLQTDAQDLLDPSFFSKVTASSSDSSVATASLSSGAATGNYSFDIIQLATEAQLNGTSYVSQVLDPGGDPSSVTVGSAGFSTPVTSGTFTVDGAPVTIASTNSLKDVFDAISTATNGKVTAGMDATNNKIVLQSSDGSAITLGSSADTSNFLQVAQLYNNNGGSANNTGTITSVGGLGRVATSATMSSADLKTPITGDSSGNGQFKINGVAFSYNTGTDSIQNILNNVNESNAGVSAAYDSINNRFVLTNTSTGDTGIAMQDVTGNFLAATGLSGGTLVHGKNLTYTLNNSSQAAVSQSNTIDSTSSGIVGLSVTAQGTGTTTVAINPDTATMSSSIQQFVTDYNTLQKYIASEQKVTNNADGSVTPGTLTGDSSANGIVTGLRTLMSQVQSHSGSSSTVSQLSDLGFQSNGNDNTIALGDSSTLTSMLTSHMGDIKAMFSDATSGLAVQLNTYINNVIGTNGSLPGRTADLTKQSTDITTQISNLETKVSNDTNEWDSEFQNMETAESQTNQELTYISQGVTNGSL